MGVLSRREFILGLAAAPTAAFPQAEFSSSVNVISLLVTVRDKSGRFVNDLTQGNFTAFEDGHPQTITYFSRQYDLPLTLGLLIDTSGSQVDVLGDELKATVAFFDQILRENMDQAFLMSFDRRDYLLQSVTSQRADTVVYAIGVGSGLARGGAALQALSEKTGGRFFVPSGKHSPEDVYHTIEEELRSQYSLGYVPPPGAGKRRAGYHKVRVTVNRPGMSVRTREGYYSGG